jgi:hypothetical protein
LGIVPDNVPFNSNSQALPVEEKAGIMASSTLTYPTFTQIEIGVTKLAAVAAGIEGSTDLGGVPSWLRITLLSVSGFIIGVNHWLNVAVKPAPPTATPGPATPTA